MQRRLSLALVPLLIPVLGFGLTLDEAVQHVTATNPVVNESVQNYRATTQDVSMAGAAFLPRIDVAIYGGRERTRNATFPVNRDLYRRGKTLTARQNLFNGFGDEYNMDQQEARVEAARQNVDFRVNALSLETTEAYLALMKQYEFLAIARKNLKTHESIHARIQERTESGFGAKSELDQSKGRLSLARSNLVVQMSNYQDALTTFERIYGLSVDPATLQKPVFAEQLPATLEGAVEAAKQHHPALAVQQRNIVAAEARLGVVKQAFYPKLDLELAIDDSYNVSGIDGEDYSSHVFFTLSYNLFNGEFDMARKEQQQIVILKEEAIQGDLLRRVRENLGFAWTAYTEIGKQIPYLKEHRDYSVTTLEAYNQEFALGRRTLVDILNTENELTSAEKEVVNAEYDLLLAQYRLLEGMGMLASSLSANSSY